MMRENEELGVMHKVTPKEKKILKRALDGIKGWNFNPIEAVTNGTGDYYFVCKVMTIIENLQMKMAKIYVKVQEGNHPRLLAIEEML
ncbi:hypothetical protein [Clostridium sp.]|uniref:hypothetical protein n=1 Tax=Clostridium sp. TaxID=1506 RepID=UPI002842A635|nr:hypothetical protein [Clostridium sp.]MDR3598525.1 hypothetical protein [Clostridium sp.]